MIIPSGSKTLYQPQLPDLAREGSFKGWHVNAKRGDNFYKIFVVVSAIFLLFAAVGVAAAATPPKPCVGDQCPSNHTCSVISSQESVGTAVLSDYLRAGQVAPHVRHFEPDDPAVVAMQVHLEKQKHYWQDPEQFRELLYEEVKACMDAAAKEKNPEEKLKWVHRALAEMEAKDQLAPYCYNPQLIQLCVITADLWIKAAEAFLVLPPGKSHQYSLFIPEVFSQVNNDRFFAASRCLRNAANYHNLEHSEEGDRKVVSNLRRAIRFLDNIDIREWSLWDRAKLHEEKANTYAALERKRGGQAHVETVKKESLAANCLYGYLANNRTNTHMRIYAMIKSGQQLYFAQKYTSSWCEEKVLLTQAEGILAKAWAEDPNRCMAYEEFTGRYNNNPFKLDNSLLGGVRSTLRFVVEERMISVRERVLCWMEGNDLRPSCTST